MKNVYLGGKMLIRQVLMKTIELGVLFLIAFFLVFLLFFLCRYPPRMSTKYMVGITWAPYIGEFLYLLDTNTRKISRRLEKLQSGIN